MSASNIWFTLSVLLSPAPLLSLLHPWSLYTSSDHETLCLDTYSQRGLVRESGTPCCSFSLFQFGQNYIILFIRGILSQAVCADPLQDRTSPPTVQDDKHSAGWCYTMLHPVRSLPVSSDPAGYAKTTERQKWERKKSQGNVYERRKSWLN